MIVGSQVETGHSPPFIERLFCPQQAKLTSPAQGTVVKDARCHLPQAGGGTSPALEG